MAYQGFVRWGEEVDSQWSLVYRLEKKKNTIEPQSDHERQSHSNMKIRHPEPPPRPSPASDGGSNTACAVAIFKENAEIQTFSIRERDIMVTYYWVKIYGWYLSLRAKAAQLTKRQAH